MRMKQRESFAVNTYSRTHLLDQLAWLLVHSGFHGHSCLAVMCFCEFSIKELLFSLPFHQLLCFLWLAWNFRSFSTNSIDMNELHTSHSKYSFSHKLHSKELDKDMTFLMKSEQKIMSNSKKFYIMNDYCLLRKPLWWRFETKRLDYSRIWHISLANNILFSTKYASRTVNWAKNQA